MIEFGTAVASYIGAAGYGTAGTDLFLGTLPETPRTCTAIILTGGPSVPQDKIRRKTFQIMCRAQTETAAMTKANSIHALFDDAWCTLAPGFKGRVTASHEPGLHARDANNDVVYFLNFEHVASR